MGIFDTLDIGMHFGNFSNFTSYQTLFPQGTRLSTLLIFLPTLLDSWIILGKSVIDFEYQIGSLNDDIMILRKNSILFPLIRLPAIKESQNCLRRC